MCGIAGIVAAHGGRVDDARLTRMRDTMVHRGPDGAGNWVRQDGSVGFAHRRLSIVELSPLGAQPMLTEDGAVALTFNGEIYNHRALREELEGKGHVFRGRSDTEVLLRGWREWGEGLLDRLIGMFAFAIWDEASRTLFAARDRMGIKPFYFSTRGGEFLFASEIKALLADPAVPRDLDPLSVHHYLTFLIPPAPLTMFDGIYKLPAGHALRLAPGGEPKIARWWDPVARPSAEVDPEAYRDEDVAARELLRLLDRSIERRMMSDVPFGVFLSGGVDSSTNVALMARHMDRPVDTFSVGFKEHPDYNELDYARLVARQYGTNHHEVLVSEKDMRGYLPALVHQQDEPIADWVCVPLYFVSKLARDAGTIVVQVGEGSDELFCGYEHFVPPVNVWRHYARPLAALPSPLARAAALGARAAGLVSPLWARRAEIAESVLRGEEIFWGGAVCYRDALKDAIWSGPTASRRGMPPFVPEPFGQYDSHAVVAEIAGRFRRENPGAGFYETMLYLELRQRLPELLLMRVDKISMSTSIEARVPFLDHHLVEFAMGLPLDMRLRRNGGDAPTGKYLLKKAVRGLVPDEVIDRRKMGFGAPMREWLAGDFGAFAREHLLDAPASGEHGLFNRPQIERMLDEHAGKRRDWSIHLWVLLNFALWHEHWIAGRHATL